MSDLIWKETSVPAEFVPMLRHLEEEYPVRASGRGLQLEFVKKPGDGIRSKVERVPGGYRITCNGLSGAARGIGSALAGLTGQEQTCFRSFGIMLDCSRGAVMTVPGVKRWLRRLALMGYNLVMLYAEETYKLEGETYFGYLRGAYTLEELQEIDAYAADLGVEMVGCIQVLGHMASLLQWPGYGKVRDTAAVLLTDAEETKKLIAKMIAFWSKAFRSRRLHVGMDEAWDLGKGQAYRLYGPRDEFEVFTRHLLMVRDICTKEGLQPIIWGDMFFRIADKDGRYYVPQLKFTPEQRRQVPKGVQLVYWDYYNENPRVYQNMIRLHRELSSSPDVMMGSGLWTWYRPWYDHAQSVVTVKPCMEACLKEKVTEFMYTLWGNCSNVCAMDSVLTGLAWGADLAFGFEDKRRTGKRFAAVCFSNYAAQLEAAQLELDLQEYPLDQDDLGDPPRQFRKVCSLMAMWDDPLLGIAFNNAKLFDAEFDTKTVAHYKRQLAKLLPYADDNEAGPIGHAINIYRFAIAKLEVRRTLEDAYDLGDRAALHELAEVKIPAAVQAVKTFAASFRRQWLRSNKPQGMEMVQSTAAADAARLEELAMRIQEYLAGERENIPELEERLPLDAMPGYFNHFEKIYTACRSL